MKTKTYPLFAELTEATIPKRNERYRNAERLNEIFEAPMLTEDDVEEFIKLNKRIPLRDLMDFLCYEMEHRDAWERACLIKGETNRLED